MYTEHILSLYPLLSLMTPTPAPVPFRPLGLRSFVSTSVSSVYMALCIYITSRTYRKHAILVFPSLAQFA